MSLFIKNVELKSNFILAPMAGYSDFVLRTMCSDYGAGLVFTEMISSSALHYKNQKTIDLLKLGEEKCPVACQIFGHNPEIMAEACASSYLSGFDIIDINMGCPARKIISNGDGSALLNDFELSRKIIEACVKATEKPITVKFRIGYTDDKIIAVEFAKMCEEAGASAITVHGRTTMQGYSGEVNYDVIKQVKQAVSIPVFANGNCKSKEDADRIFELTGADGIMVGRGAIGSPEIFSELVYDKKADVDKLEQIKNHYRQIADFYSETYAVKYLRSHIAYYLSGKYKNTNLVVSIMKMQKISEIFNALDEFFATFK